MMKQSKRKTTTTSSTVPTTPSLRFSPTAWAKLLFLRDVGETEIGGFGISRPDDLLSIEDVILIPQHTSAISVIFDDLAVADFFDEQVALERKPSEFARIWIHTHPGNCPRPSGTDEETFARVFGNCDWAVMFILARNGATSSRLQWNVGPQGAIETPVAVDYGMPFSASDEAAWRADYDRCVVPLDFLMFPEFESLALPNSFGESDGGYFPHTDPHLAPTTPLFPLQEGTF